MIKRRNVRTNEEDEANLLFLKKYGYSDFTHLVRELIKEKVARIAEGHIDKNVISTNGLVKLYDGGVLHIQNGKLATAQRQILIELAKSIRLWTDDKDNSIYINLFDEESI